MEQTVWQSYYLYVGRHYGLMDELLIRYVEPLIRDLAPVGWFFIRYVDQMGPHLRLRVRVEVDRRDSVERRILMDMTTALDELSTLPPSRYVPLVSYDSQRFASPAAPELGGPVEIRIVAYEPEWDVYGAADEGMPIAEELFQASSQIALSILKLEAAGRVNLRKTLAPCLSEAVLKVFPPEQGRQSFLRFYSSYWLTGTGIERVLGERIAEKIAKLRGERVPIITSAEKLDGEAAALLRAWEAALRKAHARYTSETRICERAQKQKLLFNFLHLMNNRIGITALDEAYLAKLMEACEEGAEALT